MPSRTRSVKVVCSKNTKWLLSVQTSARNFLSKTFNGGIMKTIILTFACALIVPLAFAQTSSKGKRQGPTTTESITVTGTIITTTTGEGAVASYQPFKTLVVREDGANNPARYVLNGTGHVVNKAGEVVQTAIKPGTRVRVYYVNTGDSRVVDHVVVL
jgi:hypothetical protein